MFYPLQMGDGLKGKEYLRGYVAQLQHVLGIKADGKWGPKTTHALGASVLTYPKWQSLPVRQRLNGYLKRIGTHLPGYRGCLATLHYWEGHVGRPYWPGGSSGVTLDPGIDLGHSSIQPDYVLSTPFTKEQREALDKARGLKGQKAKTFLESSEALQSIRITVDEAWLGLPLVARPYRAGLCKRLPSLRWADTPGAVQDALLSLVYNRGLNNADLVVLEDPVIRGDWRRVAENFALMQQDHPLKGVRRRRREEATLIFLLSER